MDSFTREYFAQQGRKGGKKGSSALSPKQRTARARKAARARWAKKKAEGKP